MKFIKRKSLIISSAICLLPILLSIALWDILPDTMAIHFDINGNPDNFASKTFTVLGLPVLMALFQIFCCAINDINSHKHGEVKKFETFSKSIIPAISIILQTATILYSLGWNIDIRRVAILIVGAVLIVTGNYLPKLNYIKNYNIDSEKAKKINRFTGFETVIMGLLCLVTLFLPPISTVIWLLFFIPYTIIGIIYSMKNRK